MNDRPQYLRPDWPVANHVHAVVSTRRGGYSQPPYDSFNLADHVGDNSATVERNRQLLEQSLQLPQAPLWLEQTHGIQVADHTARAGAQADACYSDVAGRVCVVLTADCLPLFIANRAGTEVAVAHAGWKGLQAGVIEATAARFNSDPAELCAWLGPAIGPGAFEVGADVVDTFVERQGEAARLAFKPQQPGKWLADIYLLARQRLQRLSVGFVGGGDFCTVTDKQRFYSYRRDAVTGRMASLIWFDSVLEKARE